MPILVFLGLSVLDLGPMYATDVRQHHRFMPRLLGVGHNNKAKPILQPILQNNLGVQLPDVSKKFITQLLLSEWAPSINVHLLQITVLSLFEYRLLNFKALNVYLETLNDLPLGVTDTENRNVKNQRK